MSQKNIVRLKDLVEKTTGQIFLLVGPPGSGKESFAIQYMIDGFVEKSNSIFLTTDIFPNEIIQKMKDAGTDPTPNINVKQLQFIDAFSYRTGEKVDSKTLAVQNINDLISLSTIIKRVLETNDKVRLIINSLSTIAIYNSEIAVLDFVQVQIARLKQKNYSGILIADEGMISEKVLQGIKAFVDGVLEFRPSEDQNGVLQRRVRIVYAPNVKKAGWVNLIQ